MGFTTLVSREGKLYVAWCPELDMQAKGRTAEKATSSLEDAIYAYLDSRSPTSASA